MPGRFIILEGPDRAGKSTQARLLAAHLRRAGHRVHALREPGSTPAGERIRALLRNPRLRLGTAAELFLFMAARAQLVQDRIRPALRRGATVLCDRYLYSSAAYQGAAGGLGVRRVLDIGRTATGGLAPHVAFFLDLPPRDAFRRGPRRRDRVERRPARYHDAVRRAFRAIARALGSRGVLVRADRPVREVHADIVAHLRRRGWRV